MRARGVYWAGGASVVATVVVLAWPRIPLVVPGSAFHASVETAAGAIAVFAATLAAHRFGLERQARDLALAAAFGLFAVGNVAFGAVPAVVGDGRAEVFDTWAALATRVVAAAAFCAAALLPRRKVSVRAGWLVALATVAVGVLVGVVVGLAGPWLPPGAGLPAEGLERVPGELFAHPVLTGAQLIQLGLYVVAAVGLQRLAGREHDRLAAWLAVAAVFAAAGRLHFVVYPSLYTDVVYSGDVFRLGFYVTVLIAMALELRQRYEQAAELSALQERRRLARDLHDGLAQELAFITTRTRRLARADGSEQLDEVASAAERALDESRRAIVALSQPMALPLPVALARAVEEVVSRLGAHVRFELPSDDVEASSDEREMLIRVAREAVANAARHANAGEIVVGLSNGERVGLTVRDDGVGFDLQVVNGDAHRFGITSMRERAEALGARFALRSEPGAGTTVEVLLR